MTKDQKFAAYRLLRDSDHLMRRRHHNYGKTECALDIPPALRAARIAFRDTDRKRFAA